MNSHEILRTALKIVGLALLIFAVIDGIVYFPMIMEFSNSTEGKAQAISFFAPLFVQVIIGLLLWLFPAPVANTIIRNDLTPASRDELLIGIEKIGIRILGIYLLYEGATGLLSNYISYYISYNRAIETFGEYVEFNGKEGFRFKFVAMWVEVILSILLILGASVSLTSSEKSGMLPSRAQSQVY